MKKLVVILFAALAACGIALQQHLSNALQQGLKKAAMQAYRSNSAIAYSSICLLLSYGTIATIALSLPANKAMAQCEDIHMELPEDPDPPFRAGDTIYGGNRPLYDYAHPGRPEYPNTVEVRPGKFRMGIDSISTPFEQICREAERYFEAIMRRDITWCQLNQRDDLKAQDEYYQAKRQELLPGFDEWKQWNSLRLGPDGTIINSNKAIAQANEWLDRYEKQHNNANRAASSDCITGMWTNLGPTFNNTTNSNVSENYSGYPGIGRANVVRKHPTANKVYLGTASGGLWVTDLPATDLQPANSALTWQALPYNVGVSDIAFSTTGTTMYIATGDRSRGAAMLGSTSYSQGVLKSTDNGTTWQELHPSVEWGLLDANGVFTKIDVLHTKIQRLLVNAQGELICVANVFLTLTNVLEGNTNNDTPNYLNRFGIWKYDANTGRWLLKASSSTGMFDMEFTNSSGSNILAVSATEIFRSTDGGNTFSSILQSSLPLPGVALNSKRMEIAVSADFAKVYLICTDGVQAALYKSTDNGVNFTLLSQSSGILAFPFPSGATNLALTVNPSNSNELFLGGANRTIDNINHNITKISVSGTLATLTPASKASPLYIDEYVYTDTRDFTWIPKPSGGYYLFAAHDGGVSYTLDGGQHWSRWYLHNNLCIAEGLSISTPANFPNTLYLAALDNGIFKADLNVNTGNNAVHIWKQAKEGDGFAVVVDDNNTIAYAAVNDRLYKHLPAESDPSTPKFDRMSTIGSKDNRYTVRTVLQSVNLQGGILRNEVYVTGYTGHRGTFVRGQDNPVNQFRIFIKDVSNVPFYSSEYLLLKESAVPFFANRSPEYRLLEESAVPWSAIALENGEFYVVKKPIDKNIAYSSMPLLLHGVVNSNTADNMDITWDKKSATGLANAAGKVITDLAVSPHNTNLIFASYSGFDTRYGSQQNTGVIRGKVFMSIDGGNNFTDIGTGIPDLPILCMQLHSVDAAHWYLLVGTDLGVFYTDYNLSCSGGVQWHPITGLPRVGVQDIEVVTKTTGTAIRVATYGRGVWELPVTFPASGCSCDARQRLRNAKKRFRF